MQCSCTSTPRSWSGGGGRQADEVGWGWKVTEMGWGTDKDKKGKKGGCTMTQPSKWQQKCGHGPWMVRMKPWVGTKPQIGEDGTSDRDETLGCGDRTPCCNKEVEVECPHDGGWEH